MQDPVVRHAGVVRGLYGCLEVADIYRRWHGARWRLVRGASRVVSLAVGGGALSGWWR